MTNREPLTVDELAWVTGLAVDDVTNFRSDLTSAPPAAAQAIALAESLSDGASEILRDRLTTYAQLSRIVAAEADASFAVRLVRESVLDAQGLTCQADIDVFHGPAPLTGRPGWDALIAGVAMTTGLDRVSDMSVLGWCDEPSRTSGELFDPLGVGRWRWLDYFRTPIQLRLRKVILASGNLEGV